MSLLRSSSLRVLPTPGCAESQLKVRDVTVACTNRWTIMPNASIFANFALMKARGWSYKPCHANLTFNRKVSVLHKLNFHPCHRNFLKARCRLLLLRCLWQFGWKTQSTSWMTLTQVSILRSCTSPLLWQLPACRSHLQALSFKTLSTSGGWATPPQKGFLKHLQRNKIDINHTRTVPGGWAWGNKLRKRKRSKWTLRA